MITLDHVLHGKNFPEASHWRNSHKQHIAEIALRGGRDRANEAADRILQMTIDSWNRNLSDIHLEWLKSNSEDTIGKEYSRVEISSTD